MRRKNGFVLIETLVVVLLLTVTLMTLYSTFSNIMLKTKSRANNDTLDTVYKTYFTKELLDNAYSNSQSTIKFKDSFLYYTYKNAGSSITKASCSSFSYSGMPTANNEISAESNVLIACDFSNVLNSNDSVIKNDPLYDVVNTYGITKIFYVDFSQLNSNGLSDEARKKIYSNSIFDATAIEYFKGQNKSLDGNFMVIKYSKPFVADYTADYVDSMGFPVQNEYFYSKIALSKIEVSLTAKPVMLYDTADPDQIHEEMPYYEIPDGSEFFLPSEHSFTSNAGNVIIGWVTKYQLESYEEFNKCLAGTSGNKGESDHCYNAKDVIKIDDTNRKLYAVWCGDGTLGGAIECQLKTSDGVNGVIRENETEYVYKGKPDNNYVVVGDYCFNLMSTYDTGDGIKAVYYSKYDTNTQSCAEEKTPYKSSKFGDADSSFFGYAYMYKNRFDMDKIGTEEEVLGYLNLQTVVNSHIEYDKLGDTDKATLVKVLPYNEEVYFGENVKYENGEYTLLDSSGNAPTSKVYFFANPSKQYNDIKTKFVGKYFCEGGQKNKCSKVYLLVSCSDTGYAKYYSYSNGNTADTVKNKEMAFSDGFTYSDGKYKLDTSNMFYIKVGDYARGTLDGTNNAITTLKTHRYACDDYLRRGDGDAYYCNTVKEVLSVVQNGRMGAVITYKDGLKSDIDVMNYVEGNTTIGHDERTKDSDVKKVVDEFFQTNYDNETYSSFFDYDVTFCNEHSYIAGFGRSYHDTSVKNHRNSITTPFFITYSSYNTGADKNKRETYETCTPIYEFGVNQGNQLLKYPAGLLAYIDMIRTGIAKPGTVEIKYSSARDHYLLNSGLTMSPLLVQGLSTAKPDEFGYIIESLRYTWYNQSRSSKGVSPVVSFKLSNKIGEGSGTVNNPFKFTKGVE